jgi:hypothetical protein
MESLNAGMVPLFAVASAGEWLRKEERGMVAREEVGLKQTCFLGQCYRTKEAVLWCKVWVVWQRVVSETEQSFLIRIDPPWAVGNVSWLQRFPRDGKIWEEAMYTSRR